MDGAFVAPSRDHAMNRLRHFQCYGVKKERHENESEDTVCKALTCDYGAA